MTTDTTKIEWTATRLPDGTMLPGYTFNPWTGCTKVSPGCDHCYAEGWSKRSGHVEWGPHGARRRTSAANWAKPIKWNAEAEASGIRRKVFCASLGDIGDNHNSIEPQTRRDLVSSVRQCPNLDFLFLSKRPQNMARLYPDLMEDWPANLWMGVSTENREEMLRRGEALAKLPARITFWSAEPLVGDLGEIPAEIMPSWIICGGESGPGARPMADEWAQSVIDQCKSAGVPVFMKQMGGARKPFRPIPESMMVREFPQ